MNECECDQLVSLFYCCHARMQMSTFLVNYVFLHTRRKRFLFRIINSSTKMQRKWKVNQYVNKKLQKLVVFLRDKEVAIDGKRDPLVQLKDVKRIHVGKSPKIFSIIARNDNPIVLETVDVKEVKSLVFALLNALDAIQRRPEVGTNETRKKLQSLKEGEQMNICFDSQNSVSFANFTRTLSKSKKSKSRSENKKSSKSRSRNLSKKPTMTTSKTLSSRNPSFHLQQTQYGKFDFDDERKKWKLAQITQFGRKIKNVHLRKVGNKKCEIWDEKQALIKMENVQRIFIGKTTDILLKSVKCKKVPHKRFFTFQTKKGVEFNFEEQERGAKNNLILTLLRNVNYPTIKEIKKILMNLSSNDTMQIRLNAAEGWNVMQYGHKNKKKVNITVDVTHLLLKDKVQRKTKKIEINQIREIYVGRCTDLLKTHSEAKSKPQYLFFSINTKNEKESYDFEAQHQLDQKDIIHQIFMNMTFHGLKPKGGTEYIHQKLSNLQRHETLKIIVVTDKERREVLMKSVGKINAAWKRFQARRETSWLKTLKNKVRDQKQEKFIKTNDQKKKIMKLNKILLNSQPLIATIKPKKQEMEIEPEPKDVKIQEESETKSKSQKALKEMQAERKRLETSRREFMDAVKEMRVVRQRLEESRVLAEVTLFEIKVVKKQNETRAINAELTEMEQRLIDQDTRMNILKEGEESFQQKNTLIYA